jgi:hypothetical protein
VSKTIIRTIVGCAGLCFASKTTCAQTQWSFSAGDGGVTGTVEFDDNNSFFAPQSNCDFYVGCIVSATFVETSTGIEWSTIDDDFNPLSAFTLGQTTHPDDFIAHFLFARDALTFDEITIGGIYNGELMTVTNNVEFTDGAYTLVPEPGAGILAMLLMLALGPARTRH